MHRVVIFFVQPIDTRTTRFHRDAFPHLFAPSCPGRRSRIRIAAREGAAYIVEACEIRVKVRNTTRAARASSSLFEEESARRYIGHEN